MRLFGWPDLDRTRTGHLTSSMSRYAFSGMSLRHIIPDHQFRYGVVTASSLAMRALGWLNSLTMFSSGCQNILDSSQNFVPLFYTKSEVSLVYVNTNGKINLLNIAPNIAWRPYKNRTHGRVARCAHCFYPSYIYCSQRLKRKRRRPWVYRSRHGLSFWKSGIGGRPRTNSRRLACYYCKSIYKGPIGTKSSTKYISNRRCSSNID